MNDRKSKSGPRKNAAKGTVLPKDKLTALFLVSQRINQINDVRELLHEILHTAITRLEAERGLIILTDETGESYRTVASESLDEEDLQFSTSIVRATLDGRQTVTSANPPSDDRFKEAESITSLNILSFICVPLVVPGRELPIGTLYIDQRIHVKTFTDEDVAFLEAFANLAAVAISNASLVEELLSENIRLRQEVGKRFGFPGVIGQSESMQKVFRDMKQILDDNCTVLITGESGTGKEVIAKAIHYNSVRKERPFLAVNCGALPENLLEAELFGSVRGAFTGAIDKQGLFQAAQGGTLFLDEIQHTSEAMQIKLLRVLQEREIRRVGGTRDVKVDVRLICATNEDLRNVIQEGRFRQDFYYRINVVTLDIPPLRDRRDDIPLLAQHFLEKYTQEKGKVIHGFDKGAMRALMSYDWVENNVRELENEIERAIIFSKEGNPIKRGSLSEKLRGTEPITGRPGADILEDDTGEPLTFEEFEKKYIRFVLSRVAGNKARAAQLMGIPRSTLRGKMRKLNMRD